MVFLHSALRMLAAGGAGFVLSLSGASAQTPIAPGDETRPLYATSDDIRDGKELADTTCAKCHGA